MSETQKQPRLDAASKVAIGLGLFIVVALAGFALLLGE